MIRLPALLCIAVLLACPSSSTEEDPAERNSTVILASIRTDDSCSPATGTRYRREIFDLKGIQDVENSGGKDYYGFLLLRDDIVDQQSGIGAKRLLLNYSFDGNLRPPSQPTLNELSNGVEVPFGGFTDSAAGTLVVAADLIPERIAGLFAADPVIREHLVFTGSCSTDADCPTPQRCNDRARQCVDPFNHVGGLPAFYQVQVKAQTVVLSEKGVWIRSPAFYLVIDLCNGCLTRLPEVAVRDPEAEAICNESQTHLGIPNQPPTFPNLAAIGEVIEQEIPDEEGGEGGGEGGGGDDAGPGGGGGEAPPAPGIGPTELRVTTGNSGEDSTVGSPGAASLGRSKTAVWLIHPRHANQRNAPLELPDADQPPNDYCPVQGLAPEQESVCVLQGHPKRCNGLADQPLCLHDSDCAGDVSCLAPVTFAVEVAVPGEGEPEIQQRRCRVSSQDEDDPQAVDCVWLVCADYNNQVMEWKMDADWDTLKDNCSCVGLDQETTDTNCPVLGD